MESYIPKLYHKVAIEYPCTATDLFNAVPFAPEEVIRRAAEQFAIGAEWWQVKKMFLGSYEHIYCYE